MTKERENQIIYDALHTYFMIFRFSWATSLDKGILQNDDWRKKCEEIDEILVKYADLVY